MRKIRITIKRHREENDRNGGINETSRRGFDAIFCQVVRVARCGVPGRAPGGGGLIRLTNSADTGNIRQLGRHGGHVGHNVRCGLDCFSG